MQFNDIWDAKKGYFCDIWAAKFVFLRKNMYFCRKILN